VGWWYFAKLAGLDASPYIVPDEDILAADHPITNVLRWANEAGLHIIFVSHAHRQPPPQTPSTDGRSSSRVCLVASRRGRAFNLTVKGLSM
jgi:nicotinamidase-related amidase